MSSLLISSDFKKVIAPSTLLLTSSAISLGLAPSRVTEKVKVATSGITTVSPSAETERVEAGYLESELFLIAGAIMNARVRIRTAIKIFSKNQKCFCCWSNIFLGYFNHFLKLFGLYARAAHEGAGNFFVLDKIFEIIRIS